MNLRTLPTFCATLLWLLMTAPTALAQKEHSTADQHYQQMEYALAIEAYKAVLTKQQPSVKVVGRIADAYRRLNNSKEAEFWYAQLMAFPDYNPTDLRHYADAARMNGNYQKAKQLYLSYAEQVPDAQREAMQLIATAENAQAWLQKPQPYQVAKHPSLNSENTDFSPVFYQKGLVFTSDRKNSLTKKVVSAFTGRPNSALYFSLKDSSGFQAPVLMPAPIQNKHQNGSAVFSADGQTIYFTRINQIKQKSKKTNTDPFSWISFAPPAGYINRLELFIAQRQGDKWGKPQPFPFNKPAQYSIGHPALSKSGDTLYFASDMPGSLGDSDIFFSVRQGGGSWSTPENLGSTVNTPQKEVFPVIGPKGKLYFSSNGHSGMGGLDIFRTEKAGSAWKTPQNLKYPLNSPADDFGLLLENSGETGYLSSNRESTDGSDDIFTFRYAPVPCHLAGKTVERMETRPGVFKEIPVANVLIRLYQEGDTASVVTYSDLKGNFTFPIFDGINYTVKAVKTGYLIRSAGVLPTCESVVDMVKFNMVLNKNTLNQPILLENIYYDLDKYEIRADAALELDKLVQTLLDNPTIRIELNSHTDSRQTYSYNNLLSQMRAQSVVNYLVSRGIDRSRLTAKGYGETRLMNRCRDGVECSEEEHQLNRRTEFKILKL